MEVASFICFTSKVLHSRQTTNGKSLNPIQQYGIEDDKVYLTRYHFLVTNLILPAIEIWELYKRRGDVENRIKDLKKNFGVEGCCMDSFLRHTNSYEIYNDGVLFNEFVPSINSQKASSA